ncbi:NAD(P)H-dependent oxidoreductase [Frankia sp. CNm7]|uniref:NAD(P)H-dependent oxidoreductase n=2 Tax=Frankia nepalensis TaxID=1836974 RepID=A0A937RPG9_9ACTN|nr:NAD(P)H-dependent oxidoreductase [Frankia nepalensis]MBL7511716.1 NAD(P)H-dependent oxidoreductase [Frankia nepalensis]MBL7523172.1 NAD(P)H-dependent oxidoreductase [Frankia nepalensis]MBL7632524.1 NAD(P)H-dependent oxidoreductase [Frankia nepalensis]
MVRDGSPLAVRRSPSPPADRGAPGLERRTPGVGPGQAGRRRPLIVGLCGSSRPESPTMRALGAATRMLAQAGAETVMLSVTELDLPPYQPDSDERPPGVRRLVGEISRADGLVIAAPDYLGGTSGLIKNALDYLWDLRDAPRPCLDARPVGLLACEEGSGVGGALPALRATVHALGGWPTPLGIRLTQQECATIDPYGAIASPAVADRFGTLTDQMMGFCYAWSHLI